MTLMGDREKKSSRTQLLSAERGEGERATPLFARPPSRAERTLALSACLLLFSLALGLNLYRIGGPSLWFDEILSVARAWQPLPVLFKIISTTQPNMALYYVLLHFWLSAIDHAGFSATEALVRLPSAFFSAAGSLVLYFLARRFFSARLAFFTTLLYILNTLQLTYAQETRSYALQLLLILCSWYALCVLLSSELTRGRARAWWLVFVLTSALAVYSQLFSGLVLCAQVGTVALLCVVPTAWRTRARRQLSPLILNCAWIGVLIAPLLYASRVGPKTGWLPVPGPADLAHLFLTVSSQNRLFLLLAAPAILLGLCAGLLTAFPQGRRSLLRLNLLPRAETQEKESGRRPAQWLPLALLLSCWLLCPVAISYLVSQKAMHLFAARYLVVIVPAFVMLIGLGLSVPRQRMVRIVYGLCLLLPCLASVPGYYAGAQVEDWRTGARWLQQNYLPGDGLICYNNAQGCAVSIEYYLRVYPRGAAHFDADSPGYFPWISYDTTNQLSDSTRALNVDAMRVYAEQHERLFFAIGRASLDDPRVQSTVRWLNANYHLLARKVTATLTITLNACEYVQV